jgi:hypothetical protein
VEVCLFVCLFVCWRRLLDDLIYLFVDVLIKIFASDDSCVQLLLISFCTYVSILCFNQKRWNKLFHCSHCYCLGHISKLIMTRQNYLIYQNCIKNLFSLLLTYLTYCISTYLGSNIFHVFVLLLGTYFDQMTDWSNGNYR